LHTCSEGSIFQHTFRTLQEHHLIREGFSNVFNGFTTKLSVVIARRTPPMLSKAASFSSGRADRKQQGSKQAFHQAPAGDASRALGHFDLRLAKLDSGYRAVTDDRRFQASHARVVAIAFRWS